MPEIPKHGPLSAPYAARGHNESLEFNGRRLYIEYLSPASLKLDAKNPRKHNRHQRRKIARSLRQWGFVIPLVIDDALNVIAGNACLMAALDLGFTEVPVVRVHDLSEAEKKALQIALNRLAELSEWDDPVLAEILRDLSVANLDLDIEITGFDMGEIDLRIESLTAQSNDKEDPADRLPAVDQRVCISHHGDLWLVGPHRLLCGSALDGATCDVLFAASKAQAVFTDPPYNVKIAGNVSGLGKVCHGEFLEASGEMSDDVFTDFLGKSCANMATFSVPGALIYACMDWRHVDQIVAAGRAAFGNFLNICVWVKSSPGMGSFYRSQHEFVCVFGNGKVSHRNNVQLGRFGRNRTNVWNYPSINNFGRPGEEGNLLHLHPTVKPVALVADAIMDSTARGDLVFDPFCGSGTTIIAAERVGRRCNAIELDPRYVDVAIRRWQALTGNDARHAVSGRTFNDLAAKAEAHHVAQ